MSSSDPIHPRADPAKAAADRDRLGRSHQLRVDIAIALSLVPAWLKRAISDKNDEKARGARGEIVERIAVAIERRFRVTWHGSSDHSEDALPGPGNGPLFGGPADPKASHDRQNEKSCSAAGDETR